LHQQEEGVKFVTWINELRNAHHLNIPNDALNDSYMQIFYRWAYNYQNRPSGENDKHFISGLKKYFSKKDQEIINEQPFTYLENFFKKIFDRRADQRSCLYRWVNAFGLIGKTFGERIDGDLNQFKFKVTLKNEQTVNKELSDSLMNLLSRLLIGKSTQVKKNGRAPYSEWQKSPVIEHDLIKDFGETPHKCVIDLLDQSLRQGENVLPKKHQNEYLFTNLNFPLLFAYACSYSESKLQSVNHVGLAQRYYRFCQRDQVIQAILRIEHYPDSSIDDVAFLEINQTATWVREIFESYQDQDFLGSKNKTIEEIMQAFFWIFLTDYESIVTKLTSSGKKQIGANKLIQNSINGIPVGFAKDLQSAFVDGAIIDYFQPQIVNNPLSKEKMTLWLREIDNRRGMMTEKESVFFETFEELVNNYFLYKTLDDKQKKTFLQMQRFNNRNNNADIITYAPLWSVFNEFLLEAETQGHRSLYKWTNALRSFRHFFEKINTDQNNQLMIELKSEFNQFLLYIHDFMFCIEEDENVVRVSKGTQELRSQLMEDLKVSGMSSFTNNLIFGAFLKEDNEFKWPTCRPKVESDSIFNELDFYLIYISIIYYIKNHNEQTSPQSSAGARQLIRKTLKSTYQFVDNGNETIAGQLVDHFKALFSFSGFSRRDEFKDAIYKANCILDIFSYYVNQDPNKPNLYDVINQFVNIFLGYQNENIKLAISRMSASTGDQQYLNSVFQTTLISNLKNIFNRLLSERGCVNSHITDLSHRASTVQDESGQEDEGELEVVGQKRGRLNDNRDEQDSHRQEPPSRRGRYIIEDEED